MSSVFIPVNVIDFTKELTVSQLNSVIKAATNRRDELEQIALTEDEKSQVENNNTIYVIKSLRNKNAISLRQAKDIVDRYRYENRA